MVIRMKSVGAGRSTGVAALAWFVLWLSCLWATGICNAQALAADSSQFVTGRLPESLIPAEDALAEMDREEERWTYESLSQIGFKRISGYRRPSHLGGPGSWQWRTSLRSGSWQWSFVADKDASEPWGAGRLPWTGPELKRWSLLREGRRVQGAVGSFRIRHGFGLHSGRRAPLLPGASGILSVPSRLATVTSYAGTSGRPTRSGILVGIRGPKAGVWFWQSRTAVTVSTVRTENRDDVMNVTDISHTSSFRSTSSLIRRRQLALASSGLMMASQGDRVRISAVVEHVTTNLRSTSTQLLALSDRLPQSILTGSLAAGARMGRWDAVGEAAWAAASPPDVRTAIRWRSRGGSGFMLDHARLRQSMRNPFGHSGKFLAPFMRERMWRAGGQWQAGAYHTISGRWALRGRSGAEDANRTQQAAVDWIRFRRSAASASSTARSMVGLRVQEDLGQDGLPDRSARVIVRTWIALSRRWHGDLQVQVGLREDTEKSGWTALVAPSLKRAWGAVRRFKGVPSPVETPPWEYTIAMVMRRHHDARTTLYASFPTVTGAFPVLSGSSNLVTLGQRLRWTHSVGVNMDVTLRMDRLESSDDSRYRVTFAAQLRIPLGNG